MLQKRLHLPPLREPKFGDPESPQSACPAHICQGSALGRTRTVSAEWRAKVLDVTSGVG
jgi:hypothetical protein